MAVRMGGFNPRALTSPDRGRVCAETETCVSIHGLLRALTSQVLAIRQKKASFNPRALTSPDTASRKMRDESKVSIHGLLRALTEACLI